MSCEGCGCKKSWHHANQKQKDDDGNTYIRTCFGLACKCTLKF